MILAVSSLAMIGVEGLHHSRKALYLMTDALSSLLRHCTSRFKSKVNDTSNKPPRNSSFRSSVSLPGLWVCNEMIWQQPWERQAAVMMGLKMLM